MATSWVAQGLPGLGQAVEQPALGVQRAFRGIEVLGLAFAHDAAAEGHGAVLPVEDGEDDPVPEAVVVAAGGPGQEQPHLGRGLQGEAPVLQVAPQAVPFRGGVAQLKALDDFRGQAPFGEVFPAGFAGLARERLPVEGQGLPVEVVGGLALLGPPGLLGAHVLDGEGDAVAPGQLRRRLREAQLVVLHDEGDDVAAGLAAEAMEDAPVGGNGKGGLAVDVEGAEAREVFAPALEFDVLAHHLFDGGGFFDLQKLVFRDVAPWLAFSRQQLVVGSWFQGYMCSFQFQVLVLSWL